MTKADAAYFRSFYETISDLLAEKRAQEDTLEADLEEVRQEIVRLERVLSAAAPFTSGMKVSISDVAIVGSVKGLSLADAVRKILEHGPQARTPRGIRDSLTANDYDLSQHNNALASIHGVLKRMADSGEIERIEVDGKTRYRGKVSLRRALPNEGITITEPIMPPRKLVLPELPGTGRILKDKKRD